MVDRVVTVGDDLTLPESVKAADVNLPDRLGVGQLSATIDNQVAASPVVAAKIATTVARDSFATRSDTRIRLPWRLADFIPAAFQNYADGATVAAGVMSGTTASVNGSRIWFPMFSKGFRATGYLKATKSVVGSVSVVGIGTAAMGVDPADGYIGIAYVQGTGIVLRRHNAVGGQAVLVTDANLTDGQEVHFSLLWDGITHSAGKPAEWVMEANIINDTTGKYSARAALFVNWDWHPAYGGMLLRTNTASAIRDVLVSEALGGAMDARLYTPSLAYRAADSNDRYAIRLPAKPNGKLVIACHGRGSNNYSFSDAAQYNRVWERLNADGYTVVFPSYGDTWGSDATQGKLLDLKNIICNTYDLDPRIYLYGFSMGGLTALNAIQLGTFAEHGVAAAYLAAPVSNLAETYAKGGSYVTEIDAAYPTQAQKDAHDPMKVAVSRFAGVPMLFVASPEDDVVPKAQHTDLLRARFGTAVTHQMIGVLGEHDDDRHQQPEAASIWFNSQGF